MVPTCALTPAPLGGAELTPTDGWEPAQFALIPVPLEGTARYAGASASPMARVVDVELFNCRWKMRENKAGWMSSVRYAGTGVGGAGELLIA